MAVFAAEVGTALVAFVNVVSGEGIASADLEFHIPVLAEDDGITVGEAGSCKPALVASFIQQADLVRHERNLVEYDDSGDVVDDSFFF